MENSPTATILESIVPIVDSEHSPTWAGIDIDDAQWSIRRNSTLSLISPIADFFAEDDGTDPLRSWLSGIRSSSPSSSTTSLPLIVGEDGEESQSDRNSVASFSTFFPARGAMEFSLEDVCDFIDQGNALKGAEIVSIRGYCEPAGLVTHRFIILQLQRARKKTMWLRLDRRRGEGVSDFGFVLGSGVTKANDRASLSADLAKLVQGASQETRKDLTANPTLNDLSRLLRIIIEELVYYKLWPENCWFFCSLIQQHLAGAVLARRSDSEWLFESAMDIKYVELGQEIRRRVFSRYWGSTLNSSQTAASDAPSSLRSSKLRMRPGSWVSSSRSVETLFTRSLDQATQANLSKKYGKLGQVLGVGAGGTVRLLKGSVTTGETYYAVKEFRAKKAGETLKEHQKKITAEFCVGSALHHPNIIETIDLISDNKHYYEVMEYAPYDLLSIVMTGKMSRPEIYCVFRQICDGVSYMHSMGLAHRDIQPENCMMTTNNLVKLIDFGSATVFHYPGKATVAATGITGMGPFIAPEILTQSSYDPRKADVWSVAVLFLLMTLRRFPWKVSDFKNDVGYRSFVITHPQLTVQRVNAEPESVIPGGNDSVERDDAESLRSSASPAIVIENRRESWLSPDRPTPREVGLSIGLTAKLRNNEERTLAVGQAALAAFETPLHTREGYNSPTFPMPTILEGFTPRLRKEESHQPSSEEDGEQSTSGEAVSRGELMVLNWAESLWHGGLPLRAWMSVDSQDPEPVIMDHISPSITDSIPHSSRSSFNQDVPLSPALTRMSAVSSNIGQAVNNQPQVGLLNPQLSGAHSAENSIFSLLPRESQSTIERMMLIEPSRRCTLSHILHGFGCRCGAGECRIDMDMVASHDGHQPMTDERGIEIPHGDEWLRNISCCSHSQADRSHHTHVRVAGEKVQRGWFS